MGSTCINFITSGFDGKINDTDIYRVTKYSGGSNSDLGNLLGTDLKQILKNYSYDKDLEMFFSKAGNVGYDVKPV